MIAGQTLEARLQTLLDGSRRLSESIDYQTTLTNVVQFVADRFASYSLLDLVADDNRIERVAVAHSDPTRQVLVERIRAFNPIAALVETHPVARAVVHGEATVELVDDEWIERAAMSADHAQTMRDLEIRSLLVVPVTSGPRVLGSLTCALDRYAVRQTFDASDVVFAEELGRRAGLAIENASLYEHERRIAFTLQAASLPARLPTSEALRLDAYYRPARSESTIGGDWYDAFNLEDGRIALTVGDVVGKGLTAAVTMVRLRQSMQAAAMLVPSPDAMLRVADQTLRMQDDELYATAIAAIFDPKTNTFEFASAGHPMPMLRHPDGRVEVIEVSGTMLGVGSIGERAKKIAHVPEGATVVLYTDGIVEVTRDFLDGERRLAEKLTHGYIFAEERPARALVDAVLELEVASDDVAVLVATVVAR